MIINKIAYTQTFENQLHERFSYLTRHIGAEASWEILETFLYNFETRVLKYPKSAPLCEETADIGLTSHHDYVDTKLQLRAIYKIDEANHTVIATLFLNTRQSLRQALIQYCLRRD
ncbi:MULTISPECIES: type II toxin-antitoxin system RelE/ParE family toxin [Photorhabdus]|uniref:Type II toxin-antitoxin system RelE/ParE family toxin n=2 Tax=Photorhabdus TaxID=29487 RepID=A0ABX0B6S8_9GAMM|nr:MULTISPECIES: type II toxin-antitoxin system RelE/ParE family toxin [Photorhabdus]MCC8373521.1 type II toxin-antitoxin system RelE/ParE family toxin [Photorhabdus bodei]MCC8464110.1 type II toxin-antitoxin system RelE/ParE family toxin [Photorhabdus bodei]MCT8350520.1 type II toxin-antitoxin system RelE/ParE family toxin [Photorhabdus kayaii]MDB6372663.1 type II toxin-antitoxin system RelE/ParE family toxin [Photorhabdus bodei]NDL13744.1 type II toxin-antitoxin system RelE/ParE family toxin